MGFRSHILQDDLMRYTMDAPEREYYRVPFKLPKLPSPGYALLSRRPLSMMFKVTWSGGQSMTIMGDDPRVLQKLAKFGITQDVAERSLQHIWNFGLAYVKLQHGYPDAPPVVMPTSVLAGRKQSAVTRSLPAGNTGEAL